MNEMQTPAGPRKYSRYAEPERSHGLTSLLWSSCRTQGPGCDRGQHAHGQACTHSHLNSAATHQRAAPVRAAVSAGQKDPGTTSEVTSDVQCGRD